ncbi:MAG TPA: hypothetical protein VF677_01035 [Flavobacterium sp.]
MAPDDLIVKGGAVATNGFKDEVNKGLGGFATFDVDKNGKASLTKTEQAGQMTKEQSALFDTFNKTINDSKTTTVDIVANDPNVEIGQFDTGKIDIADAKKLGSSDLSTPQFVSTQGAIGHEISEQYQKQTNGAPIKSAHAEGLKTENAVNGSKRTDVGTFQINDSSGNPIPGGSSIQSTSTIGTTTKIVNIIMFNGNVNSVK